MRYSIGSSTDIRLRDCVSILASKLKIVVVLPEPVGPTIMISPLLRRASSIRSCSCRGFMPRSIRLAALAPGSTTRTTRLSPKSVEVVARRSMYSRCSTTILKDPSWGRRRSLMSMPDSALKRDTTMAPVMGLSLKKSRRSPSTRKRTVTEVSFGSI